MKVELKQIIDQLSETCNLDDNHKVSALIDDTNDTIVGWTIIRVYEDGTIKPLDNLRYKSIKELIEAYV